MLANLNSNQLEYLTTTNRDHRLDLLIEPASDPTSGLTPAGFETADACRGEDRRRARGLRGVRPKRGVGLPDGDAAGLADLLDSIADPSRTKPLQPCLASAVSMRGRRVGVLGAVLELVGDHPELETAWVTATHPTLRFDHRENWSEVVGKARKRFEEHLEACDAMTAPGFLIAHLAGHFDPRVERFRLQFRGIAGGDKLARLRELKNRIQSNERPSSDLRLASYPIGNLPRQIAGIMPSFLTELVISPDDKVTDIQRMSEPYHSIYLMWLSQRSLAELWVASGVFYLNGRLAISVCGETGVARTAPAPAIQQGPASARRHHQRSKKRNNISPSPEIADPAGATNNRSGNNAMVPASSSSRSNYR
jgi:hypothetical protein